MTAKKKTGKKNSKMNKQITRVALVIDRSGSMDSVRQQAVQGVNEQIRTLKENAELGGDTFVSLIQFNSQVDVVLNNVRAEELPEFHYRDYIPSGGTAMRDGVLRAIETLQAAGDTENTAYLIVVISDGEENSSRLISSVDLAEKIQDLQNTGRWTVTYMLSNQDLAKVAKSLNLNAGNVSGYSSTMAGTSGSFATMANSTAQYLTTRSTGVLSVSNFYTPTPVQDSIEPLITISGNAVISGNGNITVTPNTK